MTVCSVSLTDYQCLIRPAVTSVVRFTSVHSDGQGERQTARHRDRETDRQAERQTVCRCCVVEPVFLRVAVNLRSEEVLGGLRRSEEVLGGLRRSQSVGPDLKLPTVTD